MCGEILVLDGNKKNCRPICAATEAGYMEYTGLPGKTSCLETPEQKSRFCSLHKPRLIHSTEPSAEEKVAETLLRKKITRNSTFNEVGFFWLFT